MAMSEDVPPYLSRTFVCEVCRRPFTPPAEELQELEALELLVGIDADKVVGWCERCQGDVQ
jgi:hypothetical protein